MDAVSALRQRPARLIEQVVFPTPPFWFAIKCNLVNASPSCGSNGDVHRVSDGSDHRPMAQLGPSDLSTTWRKRRVVVQDIVLYSELSTVVPAGRSSMVRATGS